jgi:hypothetical protein
MKRRHNVTTKESIHNASLQTVLKGQQENTIPKVEGESINRKAQKYDV